ncbi:MAG: S8 family serine peptidase [Bacteroidetes bacterium]|nr:S8 family serine peptidase [Bacteroidota bacterium]
MNDSKFSRSIPSLLSLPSLPSLARLMFAAGILLLAHGVWGQSKIQQPPAGTPVPGEIIVKMSKGVKSAGLLMDVSLLNGVHTDLTHVRELSPLAGIHLLAFGEGVDGDQLLGALRSHPDVVAAQYNHYVEDRATPNDPQFGSQWHHIDGSDNDIDSDLAWDLTTGGTTANGDRIVVAVLEGGGSNYNHTDLIDNHWTNGGEIDGNGIDDDGNGFVDDVNGWNASSGTDNISAGGHGTSVSGMIGAVGNNGNGGAGVNWDVEIMQVQMGSLTESNVIAAYNYPYTMRNLYNTTNGAQGAFVVATNASWGIDNANPANYPVWCAYYDDLGAVGILNCGATANNNVNIDVVGDMPTGCGSDYMVAVTATNSNDVRTFSGYGATTIDLGAPGESVFLPSGSSGYGATSGTSFASPCVAGAIALVYSAPCSDLASNAITSPQLTANAVRGYILDGVDVVSNLIGETVTGGRLNVRNALDLALSDCNPDVGCTDPLACNYSPQAITDSGNCLYFDNCGVCGGDDSSCQGCTDATACNYDPAALIDDGSCILGGEDLTVTLLTDNYPGETTWSVTNANGETVASGGPYSTPGTEIVEQVCIDAGCYVFTINDSFGDGMCCSWGVGSYAVSSNGNVLASGASFTDSESTSFCLGDGFGCTDTAACNYDAEATTDDGTCDYDCTGCTDATACNYDPTALIDDGSCIQPDPELGCSSCDFDVNAVGQNLAGNSPANPVSFDASGSLGVVDFTVVWTNVAGDGSWAGDLLLEIVDPSGACVGIGGYDVTSPCTGAETWPANWNTSTSGTFVISLDLSAWGLSGDGSWTINMLNGWSISEGASYDVTLTMNGLCGGEGGVVDVPGCTELFACNFNPSATLDDGSCTFPYDIVYEDLDGDGIGGDAGLADICPPLGPGLSLMTGDCDDNNPDVYPGAPGMGMGLDNNCDGQITGDESVPCPWDLNQDGVVSVADILLLLGDFGCQSDCSTDINVDGVVSVADILVLLSHFGEAC